MVIARLSPGLANQMMEYMASYALAEELGQELVLDISECRTSPWGYLLDFFNIPDTRKLLYFCVDAEHAGHADIKGIPKALKEQVTIFTEDGQRETIEYKGLNEIPYLKKSSNIYMCGYFFNRSRYYEKYWKTIRDHFSLQPEIKEVQKFRELIKNKVSVGVHIRRGDMLLADWALKMEGDYYRAAIAYCRKHFNNCIFCIFSDDLDYAKDLLGKDSSVYYVHFLGYDDADVAEFICLSYCNHRILSNSSTFGRLADDLNGQNERYTFYQGNVKSELLWHHYIKKIHTRNDSKKWLDKWDVYKYARKYKYNNKENVLNWKERTDRIIKNVISGEAVDEDIISEIAEISLNMYESSTEYEQKLLYCKFVTLSGLKKYHEALLAAYPIYETYADDLTYRKNLVEALKETGAAKEAELELKRAKSQRHFVIVPKVKSYASGKGDDLVELGIVLHHMGHKVSFIFEPIDDSELQYIQKNKMLISRHDICLGCYQYLKQKIRSSGFERFLSEQEEDELIVITRDMEFCGQKTAGKKIKYVFPDYSDTRDGEAKSEFSRSQKELEYLHDMSDFILTHNSEKAASDYRYVLWKDDDHKEEYWIEERRWKFGDLHRMSERVISMACAITDNM